MTIDPGSIIGQFFEELPPGEYHCAPTLGVEFEHPWVIFKED